MIHAFPKPETAPKQKATRVEELSQLPLREWPDLERWLTVMSEQFSIELLPAGEVLFPVVSGGDGYSGPITPGNFGGTRNWSRLGGPQLHSASYLSTERAVTGGGHEEQRHVPMLETSPSSPAVHGTVTSGSSASIARSPSDRGKCARSLPAARDDDPTTAETGPARQLTQGKPNIYF